MDCPLALFWPTILPSGFARRPNCASVTNASTTSRATDDAAAAPVRHPSEDVEETLEWALERIHPGDRGQRANQGLGQAGACKESRHRNEEETRALMKTPVQDFAPLQPNLPRYNPTFPTM